MQRLQIILTELVSGRGALLMLVGDAGIGKTRLLAELRATAAGRVTWLEGGCLSYGTESAVRALHRDAAQVDRRRGGRGRPRSPHEAPREAGSAAGVPGPGRSSVPRAAARDQARRRPGRQPGRAQPRGARGEAAARVRAPGSARSPRRGRSWSRSRTCTGPTRPRARSPKMCSSSPTAHPILLISTSRIDPESEGWKLRARGLMDFPHRAVGGHAGTARRRRSGAAARLAAAEQ